MAFLQNPRPGFPELSVVWLAGESSLVSGLDERGIYVIAVAMIKNRR